MAEPEPGHELKRCAGCSTVLYCNKECQKAAWPQHRTFCQPAKARHNSTQAGGGPEAVHGPFSSMAVYVDALTYWRQSHYQAIQTIVKGHAVLEGGVEREASHPHKMLFFRLALRDQGSAHSSRPRAPRNPALTFALKEHYFMPREFVAASCSSGDKTEDAETEALHQLSLQDPSYDGFIPVIFNVEGIEIQLSGYYPQFRPAKPVRMAQERKEQVVRAVLEFCQDSINGGFPLQVANSMVVPGKFVREGGKWEWKPSISDWESYCTGDEGNEALDATLERLDLPQSPSVMMSLVAAL
ncbi:hypothetical protein OH76DRAFT_1400067 [Lentinus brumalis]|uniref:MYND-type domain-containing protein n=1 Tax=Lentinus brumalis TaxID=2498619 RepID=A0A371DJV4_9APHY|nr:hypothetical protein OH76DRAFT_1400067 [Polyporus brumalis]